MVGGRRAAPGRSVMEFSCVLFGRDTASWRPSDPIVPGFSRSGSDLFRARLGGECEDAIAAVGAARAGLCVIWMSAVRIAMSRATGSGEVWRKYCLQLLAKHTNSKRTKVG